MKSSTLTIRAILHADAKRGHIAAIGAPVIVTRPLSSAAKPPMMLAIDPRAIAARREERRVR